MKNVKILNTAPAKTCKTMKNSKKAFVLPTVIVSMLVLSLVSLLMISAMVTSKLNTGLLLGKSNNKIDLEKIYFDFKNNQLHSSEKYEILTYTAEDVDETLEVTYKAIVVSKNDKTLLFAVGEFEKNSGAFVKTINYQTNDFLFEFDKLEDDSINTNKLTFGSLIFIADNGLGE